jgi:N utilization substance protein A
MSREIVEAMKALEQEKGIAPGVLVSALEDALLSAYKKSPGAAKYARVELDENTGDYRVFELILPPELEEQLVAEAREEMEASDEEPAIDPETGEPREPEDPELDPERLAPYEDQIESRDVTPENFGRIAAQTAKQVMLQRIREAERQMMFEEYQDRVGELVTGIIQQSDNRYTLVQLRERVEALLPRSEQVWNERYDHGSRIRVVVSDVSSEGKGPSIVVSRRNPELIKSLFELEVPEIADRLVEIVGVAREPGYRSKIAVVSHADGVDPVGACVGPRGSRVRMVVSELRGEKIDIIPYNEEPARFVAKALSPARVREVLVDDEDQQATVIVPDDQLSLAIGRDGQNARLAAKLTGWKVDIKSEQEFSEMEEDLEIEEEGAESADGRCAAVLSAGRRCPNASLPGSRYCGLPQHQALARFPTNQVTVLAPLSEEEVGRLADADASEDEIRPLVERAAAAFEEGGEEEAAEEPAEAPEAEEPAGEPATEEAPVEEPAAAEAPAGEPAAEEAPAEEPEAAEPVEAPVAEEVAAPAEASDGEEVTPDEEPEPVAERAEGQAG